MLLMQNIYVKILSKINIEITAFGNFSNDTIICWTRKWVQICIFPFIHSLKRWPMDTRIHSLIMKRSKMKFAKIALHYSQTLCLASVLALMFLMSHIVIIVNCTKIDLMSYGNTWVSNDLDGIIWMSTNKTLTSLCVSMYSPEQKRKCIKNTILLVTNIARRKTKQNERRRER